MRKILLLIGCLFLGATILHADPVKIYGLQVQADLTVLDPVAPSFQAELSDIMLNGQVVPGTNIGWTIKDENPADGIVDDPGRGRWIPQGWLYADQIIHLKNIHVNTPGWLLEIYTDNTNTLSTTVNPPYSGPILKSSGSISGLVSESPIPGISPNGGYLTIPLSWKLTTSYYVINTPSDNLTTPAADHVEFEQGLCDNSPQPRAKFLDFATHFVTDLMDKDIQSGKPTWWQKVDAQSYPSNYSCQRPQLRNYEAVLTSDGAGLGDYYRAPYSTVSGIADYYLYLAAKVPAGTIRDDYQTTLFLELIAGY